MKFVRHKLDNGLEIIAECNPKAYSMAMGFFVRTGGRDESAEVAGVSHFLEHMAFKGTENCPADEVNRRFDDIGAEVNAYTNEEATVFHAAVIPDYQSELTGLLGDIMRPELRENDFEMERQVILEEIMMYRDMPPFGADDLCRAMHFGDHPLATSVLGTVESISALNVTQMQDYHRLHYAADNMAVVAAGNVDFDRLVHDVQLQCRDWQGGAPTRSFSQPKIENQFEIDLKLSAVQEYVIAMSEAPGSSDKGRIAAKLLTAIVSDDSGSQLYWELIDPGRAEHISLGHHEYHECGAYCTYMVCQPELASGNLDIVRRVYERVQCDGVDDRELDQAKSKICSRLVLSSERPHGWLFMLGHDWLCGREYRSQRDIIDQVQSVTVADVAELLERFPLAMQTTLATGPLEKF